MNDPTLLFTCIRRCRTFGCASAMAVFLLQYLDEFIISWLCLSQMIKCGIW